MNPVKFKGCNVIYAENQEEYLPLPAYKHNDEWGTVTSCWHLSFWDRIRTLFTGKIYCSLLSFDKPLTPQLLDTKKPNIDEDIELLRDSKAEDSEGS